MTPYIIFGLVVAIGYAIYRATKMKEQPSDKTATDMADENNTGCIVAAIALFLALCVVAFLVFRFVI